jgi:hypothetical protein
MPKSALNHSFSAHQIEPSAESLSKDLLGGGLASIAEEAAQEVVE